MKQDFKIESSRAIAFELIRMAVRLREMYDSFPKNEADYKKDGLRRCYNDISYIVDALGGPDMLGKMEYE